MIELSPKIDKKTLFNTLIKGIDPNIMPIVDKINEDYEYWDKVKYKKLPKGFTPQMLWVNVKASRLVNMIPVWDKYGINLCVTSQMQRLCHEFDMKFGSFWEVEGDSQSAEKKYYLSSSLMEEAIYSSKMEGASTTSVENDDNDMGYFVAYNLGALEKSFLQLRDYIQRKQREKSAASSFMMLGNINQRQALVLQRLKEEPNTIFTVKDVQEQFSVSSMTARKDLSDLVQQGYMAEIALNEVTRGYIKVQEG